MKSIFIMIIFAVLLIAATTVGPRVPINGYFQSPINGNGQPLTNTTVVLNPPNNSTIPLVIQLPSGFGASGIQVMNGSGTQLFAIDQNGNLFLSATMNIGSAAIGTVFVPGNNNLFVQSQINIGNTSLNNPASLNVNGAASFEVLTLPKTLNYQITTNDWGAAFNNIGASSKVTYTWLATASTNQQFTFMVENANGIAIQAPTGVTIRIGSTVSSAGGTVSSTTIGSAVHLIAISPTEIYADTSLGTWGTP